WSPGQGVCPSQRSAARLDQAPPRVFCRRRALAAWWNGADGDQSTKRMAEVVMPARCDAAERPNCGLRAENRGTRPGCRGSGSRPR
ncbi:MAG: hypothetical protein AVDCRST_MAG59-5363, partial [uncultured Thermomicrobiales bacterium]